MGTYYYPTEYACDLDRETHLPYKFFIRYKGGSWTIWDDEGRQLQWVTGEKRNLRTTGSGGRVLHPIPVGGYLMAYPIDPINDEYWKPQNWISGYVHPVKYKSVEDAVLYLEMIIDKVVYNLNELGK